MTFRIAIVQPISHHPGEDEANIADAVRHIEGSAEREIGLGCFNLFDGATMAALAAAAGIEDAASLAPALAGLFISRHRGRPLKLRP